METDVSFVSLQPVNVPKPTSSLIIGPQGELQCGYVSKSSFRF